MRSAAHWLVLGMLAACSGGCKSEPAPPSVPAPVTLSDEAKTDAGAPVPILLKAAHLIDGTVPAPRDGYAVLVEGERIAAVGPAGQISAPPGAKVIDLGGATLLPGLIDAHTHVLLAGDIGHVDYDTQLLKDSIPFRTIRATTAARTALDHGFTTIRDLETEGAMYADADVKRAITEGIIPGPRMFVVTRALAPTGAYPLLGYSWELEMPKGVQIVDGADNLRKAVREQIEHGADWIKVYADRSYYLPPKHDCQHLLCSQANYTDEEMRAIVEEAHRLHHRVAAHAIGWDGADSALRAGVDSLEHGDGLDDGLIDRMVAQHVYWCPTLTVGVWVGPRRGGIWPKLVELQRTAFAKALKKGVQIVFGTDVGGFPWTVNQAQEFSIMVSYGMSPMAAIQSATKTAAVMLERAGDLGTVEKDKLADIVAVQGDPLSDAHELERVTFVMKGGQIFKGP